MQVCIHTTIGQNSPVAVIATANISRNPDWCEEGKDRMFVFGLRVIAGDVVLQGTDIQNGRSVYICGLEPEELMALEDALIEKYHEDLGEAAEYRDQCRIEDLRLAVALPHQCKAYDAFTAVRGYAVLSNAV